MASCRSSIKPLAIALHRGKKRKKRSRPTTRSSRSVGALSLPLLVKNALRESLAKKVLKSRLFRSSQLETQLFHLAASSSRLPFDRLLQASLLLLDLLSSFIRRGKGDEESRKNVDCRRIIEISLLRSRPAIPKISRAGLKGTLPFLSSWARSTAREEN